jgi:hypothetical protein
MGIQTKSNDETAICPFCKQQLEKKFLADGSFSAWEHKKLDECIIGLVSLRTDEEIEIWNQQGTVNDIKKLVKVAKELFKFTDLMSRKPFFVVQPTMGIVKKNMDIIKKYDLL